MKMKREKKVKLLPQLLEYIVGDSADVFLLFVDLCGSTEYKQKSIGSNQPDIIWISRQLMFLQRAKETIQKHDGVVVKTIGDSVFAFFEATTSPEIVLKCAIEIIQGYGNLKVFRGPSKITAKASIDFGSTYNGSIVEACQFDPIGLPVDRCARLNSFAGNNEIAFSEDFLLLMREKYPRKNFKAKYGYSEYTDDLKGIGKTKYFKIAIEDDGQ